MSETTVTPAQLESRATEVLKTVFDPEIPVNIYELGLVYEIKADDAGSMIIKMTLTSPNCPVAESLPIEVKTKILKIDGINDVDVQIVWEPTWTMEMMSDAAKLELGML
jgi:FeS assembly SUF system protein